MNISLADWKELDRIRSELIKAVEVASSQAFDVWKRLHPIGAGQPTPESELVFGFSQKIHEMRNEVGMLMDTHPQSEWLGGDSDNPQNHTLREPNCCPMPRRRFTQEEIDEANLECLGPCQWRDKQNPDMNKLADLCFGDGPKVG